MTRENIMEAMNGIGEHLIVEAAEKLGFLNGGTATVKAERRKGPSAFSRFMNSGWGVAAVCALVAVSVMGGIIWAGQQPGVNPPVVTPEESETVVETTRPVIWPEMNETEPPEELTTEEEATTECETAEPHDEHVWGAWSFVQAPTCTEGGARERRCTVDRCEGVETETWPAGLHTFKGATCILCGAEFSSLSYTSNGDGTCYVSGKSDWGLNSTELVIPNYSASGELVVSIDTVDFQEMRRCSRVVLPEGLKRVGDKVFYNSQHLSEVNIPAGVTYIGDEAFYNCIIESLELPEGITYLGSGALCGNRFKELYLPASLTHIGSGLLAFSSVETVTFGEGIQIDRIPHGFAMLCSELKEISIPEGVTVIEDSAFWDSGLTAVKHMPENLTSIGVNAFADCPNLSELVLPASLTYVGDRAFTNAPALPYKVYDNVCYLPVGDNPYGVLVKLQSDVSDVTVHEDAQFLMGQAFIDCYSLITVNIRGNITTIGNNTFKNCTSLLSVSVYAPVTSIGDNAFYGCEILREVNLPNTLTSLGANAFYNCTQLTMIKLPAGITTIENGTFYGCVRLSNVSLPESVTSIGDQAFYRCRAITEMNLPKGVTSIGNEAFGDCNQMAILTMPDRLTYLGERAFYGCQALVEIEVPEGITDIEKETFSGCTSLKRVVLPDGLERLESGAFGYISALESISLPSTLTFIDRILNGPCEAIEFRGTIAEWNAITKRTRWYSYNEDMVIHCTDGDVGVE